MQDPTVASRAFLCKVFPDESNVVAWLELGDDRWLALTTERGLMVFEYPDCGFGEWLVEHSNMWERVA